MRLKLLLVLCICSLLVKVSFAQSRTQLSDQAKISLITMAPGDELHSGFGHSALWIKDPLRRIDVVFNYGVFDFDTPNFYLKFMRGKLDYMLGAGRIGYLIAESRRDERSLIEQELNFTLAEKNAIYDFLLENIKPENRYYKYDFFYDNCATRFRDLFEEVLGDQLEWRREAEGITMRDYLDIYLDDKPWQDFGIDLVLGAPTDKMATKSDEMFLPDLLMYHTDSAFVGKRKLVKQKKFLYEAPAEVETSGFQILPKHITWLLCLLGIFLSVRHFKSKLNDALFNRILFIITGLVGWIIFFLWFLSDHGATINNWNIIWAMPLNVFFAYMLFKKPAKKWHTLYYGIFGVSCFMLLGFFYVLPQSFHPAVFPIILYFTFKSFNLLYRTKKMNV